MSGFLLDTNVLSELRKGPRCNPGLRKWYEQVEDENLFISVLSLGEVRKGIEGVRKKEPAQAIAIEAWLNSVNETSRARILKVSAEVAEKWGRFAALRPIPVIDGLLVATADVHNLTFVTRNISDLHNLTAPLLNPFT